MKHSSKQDDYSIVYEEKTVNKQSNNNIDYTTVKSIWFSWGLFSSDVTHKNMGWEENKKLADPCASPLFAYLG